jgi:hypothetical protein
MTGMAGIYVQENKMTLMIDGIGSRQHSNHKNFHTGHRA